VSYRQLVSIVVLVAVGVMAVQPARAEALEPLTVLLIAGAVVLVAFFTVVAIEIVRGRPFHAVEGAPPGTHLVALGREGDETP
jgi:Na+/glutamate symporter